jgi:hypothetical protein
MTSVLYSKLLSIIWNDCKLAIKDVPDSNEILNRRVVLMNYTSRISGQGNSCARTTSHCDSPSWRDNTIHYDPDVYPGVKIQISGRSGLLRFSELGKLILTGITSHEEMEEFKSLLLSLFEKVLPRTPGQAETSKTVALPSIR